MHVFLQVALLALWAVPTTLKNPASLAASGLALVDSVIITGLIYAEQKHSTRPSKLLSIYLFVSVLLDLAQARSLILQRSFTPKPIARVFITSLVIKFVLLLLEEVPRETAHEKSSVESTSGPMNRSVFGWLVPLLLDGSRGILQVQNLGNIDHKFDSARLLTRLGALWDKDNKTAKHCLLISTLSAYKAGYLAPVLPRLCLAAFNFSQPFIIERVIEYVGEPEGQQTNNIAGGLIGATLLVYLGLAVSVFRHSKQGGFLYSFLRYPDASTTTRSTS